jgi:cephalosporin-C deacetylase-like acetyl esterase
MQIFKVGDNVLSKKYGRGIVCSVYPFFSEYPIIVRFKEHEKSYTNLGWYYTSNGQETRNINKLKLVNTRYNKLKERYV